MRRFLGVVLVFFSAAAFAQSYPSKPLKFVVGYPPGGSGDFTTRLIADEISKDLGVAVVVENRPGAGASIASEYVAKSAPDGYTLVNVQASFTANAALRTKMAYDPMGDFAYIGMMARGPLLAVVHPSLPVKNVKELIALARAKPGQINYGSTGTGGHNHMATELFARMAAIRIVHVPYKGIAPALTDLMGGHTQMVMTSLPSAMTQVQAGRLKAIATGGEKRSSFMPELPTISESGVPGFNVEGWIGLFAPSRTPRNIIDRLYGEVAKILQQREVKDLVLAGGTETSGNRPEEARAIVRDETAMWAKVVKTAGVKVE